MNILDLEPEAFENTLKELGLEPEREQFLRDEYAKKNTLSGQMLGAFQEATETPEGMVRANVLPIMRPEGMSGWEAITSGEAELALPGMLTGSIEGVGKAATTAEKMTSGIGVTEDEMQQAASTVAGMGVTGAVGRATTSAYDPDTLYMFGGLRAERPPSNTFKTAEVLANKYTEPEDVWKETGWWREPMDNKWRFEIDDSQAELAWEKIKPEINALMKATGKVRIETTLGDALRHNKLYEQYPELAGVKLNIAELPSEALGEFNPSTGAFRISPKLSQDKMKSVLLHEAQHWVQQRENFARGANESIYNKEPEVAQLAQESLEARKAWEEGLQKGVPQDRLQLLLNTYVSAEKEFRSLCFRYYRGKGGEIEARLVEDRRDMTPLERSKVSPQESRTAMKRRETLEGYEPKTNLKGQENIRQKETPITIPVGDTWSEKAKLFEILSRDDDTRKLLTLKPGDKITLPVGRNLVEGEFIGINLAKDDSYDVFNLYPEVKTSTNEYPVISFKYPNPSGGTQNGFLGLGDYLGIMLGKEDTADLRFGRPQAPMVDVDIPDLDFSGLPDSTNFAEGGMVEDKQMRRLLEEGGMTDDGMEVEPATGNRVPPGSLASEVRDDIPAQLSEGEYVVPADVVRFFGVKFFEDLRSQAKQGLSKMDAEGRIGGAKVDNSGIPLADDDELSPEEEQMLNEALGMSSGMAEGGVVSGGFDRTQFQVGGSSNIRSIKYFNPKTKEVRFFQFAGNTPLGLVPPDFIPWTAELERDSKQEEAAPTPTQEPTPSNNTRRPANSTTPTQQDGNTGYQSWADKNYESITADPFNFGMNALNDTSGQMLSKGLGGLGLVTGAAPIAILGAAVNTGNKIQNIAEANAALQVMEAQGLAGTDQYTSLESAIKTAAADVPVAKWGLFGTGNNMFAAVQEKGLTKPAETANTSGTTSGGTAPAKPASTSGGKAVSSFGQTGQTLKPVTNTGAIGSTGNTQTLGASGSAGTIGSTGTGAISSGTKSVGVSGSAGTTTQNTDYENRVQAMSGGARVGLKSGGLVSKPKKTARKKKGLV